MRHLLETRGAAWLEAVPHRRSRRRFSETPVDETLLESFERTCAALTVYDEVRVVVLRRPPEHLFTGIIGGYGKVTGAPHALALVADTRGRESQRRAGYVGQAAILEATALGLDTCWVAGFFSPKVASAAVSLQTDERILSVSPVGHAASVPNTTERTMRRMAGSDARKPLSEIAPGIGPTWPEWARAAVECARLAPSATNRQPWRFRLESGSLVVSRDSRVELPKVTKALDCGIAALHAELAARAAGHPGVWVDVDDPLDIARYETETGS